MREQSSHTGVTGGGGGGAQVWNTQTGEYAAFGENRSLSDYKRRSEVGYQPCYVVFDALWLNGVSLAPFSLAERRQRIEPMIAWEAHQMELSPQ